MWWSPCWCPTSPLSSVHFSLFYPLLFKIYNFQCLHLHWFFFLSVQFFFWIPLVNFSIQLLYFSALGFLWLLFYLFADILILFIFLNSFSCLSMYPSHSLSILKAVFLKKICLVNSMHMFLPEWLLEIYFIPLKWPWTLVCLYGF